MTEGTNHERWTDAGEDRSEDRIPLDLTRPVELVVDNPNGEVVVRAVERTDALVRAVKHGRPGTPRFDEATLVIEGRDNRIEVRPRLAGSAGWDDVRIDIDLSNLFRRDRSVRKEHRLLRLGGLGEEVRYDVEVELPRGVADSRVELRTASGDANVDGVAGVVNVATASGDVRTRATRGELAVQTASGDVTIAAPVGRLTARTASGDARVEAGAFDGFTLQTASGDVTIEATLTGDGPYRIQTVSGDARLALALPRPADGSEPGATLVFQTVSGDAQVRPAFRPLDRRTWRAGAGERGPQLAVKTVSGDLMAELTIREASTPESVVAPGPMAPPPAPEPPPPPAAPGAPVAPEPVSELSQAAGAEATGRQATRLALLEAVERGELDVEEALRRLDAAEADEA